MLLHYIIQSTLSLFKVSHYENEDHVAFMTHMTIASSRGGAKILVAYFLSYKITVFQLHIQAFLTFNSLKLLAILSHMASLSDY